MRCRLGDAVIVVRSEAGNEGKYGLITDTVIDNGTFVGWMVEDNKFRTVLKTRPQDPPIVFDAPFGIFPDTWLMPIRDLDEDHDMDAERFNLLETSL